MAPGPPQGKLGGPPQQTATKTPLPPTPNQALVQNTELTVRTRPPLVVPVRTQQAEGGPARAHRQRPSQRDQGDTNRPPPPEHPRHLRSVLSGPGVPQHRSDPEELDGGSDPASIRVQQPDSSGAQPPSQPKTQTCLHRHKRGKQKHKSRHRANNPPRLLGATTAQKPYTARPTVSGPEVDPIRARTTFLNVRLGELIKKLKNRETVPAPPRALTGTSSLHFSESIPGSTEFREGEPEIGAPAKCQRPQPSRPYPLGTEPPRVLSAAGSKITLPVN